MERIQGQKCDRPECMTQVGQTREGPWSNREPVVKLAENISGSSLGSFKVNYITTLSWGVKTWGCCLVFLHESSQSSSSCGAVSRQHSEVPNAYSSVSVTKGLKWFFYVAKFCFAGLICLPKLVY